MRTIRVGRLLVAAAVIVVLGGYGAEARSRQVKQPASQMPPEAAAAAVKPAATQADAGRVDAATLAAALAAQQPTDLKLIGDTTGWVKICPDKTSDKCEVSAGYRVAPNVPDTIVLSVATTPGPAHRVTALVPLDLNLRAGLVLTLGDSKGFVGTFSICRSMGCTATVDISDEMFRAMSKASTAYVIVQNGLGRTVSLEAPVGSFGEAVAGPGKTPDELIKARREELERAQAGAAKAAPSAAAQEPAAAASVPAPGGSSLATDVPAPPSASKPDTPQP